MTEKLEAKFTQEDIDGVVAWTDRARDALNTAVDFDEDQKDWTIRIIETLKPYLVRGNTIDMYVGALQKLYKGKTGKEYSTPGDYH